MAAGQTARQVAAEAQAAQLREERYADREVARWLVPHERVARCLRYPHPLAADVQVLHGQGPQGGTARFGGLEICGSVWLCPVCAAKITERRRRELEGGVARWVERRAPAGRGGVVLLVTLTTAGVGVRRAL